MSWGICLPFFLHSGAAVFPERWGLFFFHQSLATHTQGRTLESFEVLVKSVTYFDNIGAFYSIPCSVYIDVILNLASCSGDGDRDKVKNAGRKAVWLCSSRWVRHLTCSLFSQPCLIPFNLGPWQLCLCYCFFLSCSSLADEVPVASLFVWVDIGHVATSEAPAIPVLFILSCVDFLLRLICSLTQSMTNYIGEIGSSFFLSLQIIWEYSWQKSFDLCDWLAVASWDL